MARYISVGLALPLACALLIGCADDPNVAETQQQVVETPVGLVMTGHLERDEEHILEVPIPEEATGVRFQLSGVGDVDLYTRGEEPPNLDAFDCRPFRTGMDETCLHAPGNSVMHVLVRGWDPQSDYNLEVILEGIGTSP